jgi:hypothetical protein
MLKYGVEKHMAVFEMLGRKYPLLSFVQSAPVWLCLSKLPFAWCYKFLSIWFSVQFISNLVQLVAKCLPLPRQPANFG